MVKILLIILSFVGLSLGILTIIKLIPFLIASVLGYRKLAAASFDHLLLLWTDNNGWLITFLLAFTLLTPCALVKSITSNPSSAAIVYRTVYNNSSAFREIQMIFLSALKNQKTFIPNYLEIPNYLSLQWIASWWIFLLGILFPFTPWALKEEYAEAKESRKKKKRKKEEEKKREKLAAPETSGEKKTSNISNTLKDIIEGSFISEILALPFKKLTGFLLH